MHKLNRHLMVVLEKVLPAFTEAGIKYWVYGGIGIAGVAAAPVRDNKDVDIYVLSVDFPRVEPVLQKLCEMQNAADPDSWKIEKPGPIKETGRPKLELLIKRRERLSVVPIYKTDKGVEFRIKQSYPLPDTALNQELRTVDGFSFFTPPKEIIQILLLNKILEIKHLIDAAAIFSKEEFGHVMETFRRLKEKAIDTANGSVIGNRQ
jgi:hypothetical protein